MIFSISFFVLFLIIAHCTATNAASWQELSVARARLHSAWLGQEQNNARALARRMKNIAAKAKEEVKKSVEQSNSLSQEQKCQEIVEWQTFADNNKDSNIRPNNDDGLKNNSSMFKNLCFTFH